MIDHITQTINYIIQFIIYMAPTVAILYGAMVAIIFIIVFMEKLK